MTGIWDKVRGCFVDGGAILTGFGAISLLFILFTRRGASSVRLLGRSVDGVILRSYPCSGSLAVGRRFALSLSWQRLWIVPALWAGHRALTRSLVAVSQLHAWPRLPWRYTPAPWLAMHSRPMPWVLQPQWCPFSFASVSVRGLDVHRVGLRPCTQAHDGHGHWATREDR